MASQDAGSPPPGHPGCAVLTGLRRGLCWARFPGAGVPSAIGNTGPHSEEPKWEHWNRLPVLLWRLGNLTSSAACEEQSYFLRAKKVLNLMLHSRYLWLPLPRGQRRLAGGLGALVQWEGAWAGRRPSLERRREATAGPRMDGVTGSPPSARLSQEARGRTVQTCSSAWAGSAGPQAGSGLAPGGSAQVEEAARSLMGSNSWAAGRKRDWHSLCCVPHSKAYASGQMLTTFYCKQVFLFSQQR